MSDPRSPAHEVDALPRDHRGDHGRGSNAHYCVDPCVAQTLIDIWVDPCVAQTHIDT